MRWDATFVSNELSGRLVMAKVSVLQYHSIPLKHNHTK